MRIQNVADDAFRRYGKVLEGYDFTELLKEMKHTPVPEDVTYVPSVEEMEALPVRLDSAFNMYEYERFVLWADVVPMIGMLMIPKTCAYVWTVLIGYKAMKKEIA